MNLSLGAYVSIECTTSDTPLDLLVDTGADISIVKISAINNDFLTENTIKISGITEDTLQSIGSAKLILEIDGEQLEHDFHVVNEDFPVPGSGILGLDFIKKYACTLDFTRDHAMTLYPPETDIFLTIPFKNAPNANCLCIPPRSEVIRKIRMNTNENYVFIDDQELAEDVYVAKAILPSKNAYIRFLNCSNAIKTIDVTKIEFEDLQNFDIYPLNTITHANDRIQQILEIIEKNVPKHIVKKKEFLQLCEKYHKIFALETDKISTCNFYEQELKLKSNTPVYVKNFRPPHSQIPEINRQIQKLIDDDVVEPACSNFNSPHLLVEKKPLPGSTSKRYRLVFDYRKVNELLVDDKYLYTDSTERRF